MTIVLRDYQTAAADAIEAAWADGTNRPAITIPTGGGKTLIISELIARNIDRLTKNGQRVLVIAHREELLNQAEAEIKGYVNGVWTAVVKGSKGASSQQFANVIVASVQTLAREKRREALDRIGMVIVDECHHASARSYRDVLAHYGCMDERATPAAGVTATMTSMNGGLPDVWQALAYKLPIHQLIKRGFLVPPVAKSIEVPGLNLSKVRVTAGDLNSKDVAAALEESEAFTAMAEAWCEQASGRQTIVFMPDVATCQKMAEAFEAVCGARAEVVVGSTPTKVREAIYDRFSSGETTILIGAMVLTEGFNERAVSCVVIGRPTINPGLYVQMVGRGLRLHPDKADCLVLDFAGASLKHNLAGVNDLESDCAGRCECNCLTCGCGDQCKCGIRKCGCACLELHDAGLMDCKCADTADCSCGCTEGGCQCVKGDPACTCRGGGPQKERKDVDKSVLKTLTDVDILGAAMGKSSFAWLTTNAGIRFLDVGQDSRAFVFPAPAGGFFYGLATLDERRKPSFRRMDDGAVSAEDAVMAVEHYADGTGYSYNSRKASWRRTPATDGQLRMLKSVGGVLPASDGKPVRKGVVSDSISVALASKMLDHVFAKYVG